MGAAYQEQAKVFKALCDPKRLAILEQLRSGEKCACVLQEPLDLTQSGLSYHMKILCDSGIVVSRQEGKWTHYRLSPAGRDYAVIVEEVDNSRYGARGYLSSLWIETPSK